MALPATLPDRPAAAAKLEPLDHRYPRRPHDRPKHGSHSRRAQSRVKRQVQKLEKRMDVLEEMIGKKTSKLDMILTHLIRGRSKGP